MCQMKKIYMRKFKFCLKCGITFNFLLRHVCVLRGFIFKCWKSTKNLCVQFGRARVVVWRFVCIWMQKLIWNLWFGAKSYGEGALNLFWCLETCMCLYVGSVLTIAIWSWVSWRVFVCKIFVFLLCFLWF